MSSTLTLSTEAAVVGIGPNVSIVNLPQDRQQVEPTIAVDPRNSSILVGGAQDYRLKSSGEHRWHGYYRSTDGGATWTQSLLPGFPGDNSPQGSASPLKRFNATSDPVLAFDRYGSVYYAGIAFNITSTGIASLTAFVARYVNDGAVYSGVTVIGGIVDADKPWIAVDTTGGPNDGNVYVAFDATVSGLFTAVFARSTDHGASFSTPFKVPSGCGGLPGVAVDSSGSVYVSTFGCDPATGQDLNLIQVSKLTNGGSVLASTITVVNPITPLPSPLPGNSFRTFTIPQIAADVNGVYLAWDDFGSGNANVFVSRSVDAGGSWSAPTRVNDVVAGQQFFPTIAASGGIVSVAWYDSRLNSGTTITALDVFYAQSTDAGQTFTTGIRVTSSSFDPNLVKRTDQPNTNDPFMGDYIHIAATPSTVHPIWADNRNACDTVDPVFGCVDQDVFTSTITVTRPAFHDVAVPNMRVSRGFAYAGVSVKPIQVNVTVSNLGSTAETFTVTAKANTLIIGTRTVGPLAAGEVAVVTFDWDTNTLPVGNYTLTGQASTVSGEVNTGNNNFSDGIFHVKKAGDVDGDGDVDLDDLISVYLHQFTQSSVHDINNDGAVDLDDLIITFLHQFT